MLLLSALATALIQVSWPASMAFAQAPTPPEPGLVGSLLLPDGQPAPDVRVELRGMPTNGDLVRLYGLPEDWRDRTTTTDASGGFRFEFEPHPAFQYFVECGIEGAAPLSWRMSGLEPSEHVDLGAARFERGNSARGFVVDSVGEPPSVTVTVLAQGPRPAGLHRSGYFEHAAVDPETGAFTFADLPAGAFEFSATPALGLEGTVTGIEIPRASEEPLEIRLPAGPDPTRAVRVTTFHSPFHIFTDEIEAGGLLLESPDGSTREFERVPGRSQDFEVQDVLPGSYRVLLRDRKFEAQTLAGVEPGQRRSMQLVGSASLSLHIVDAAGRPAEGPLQFETRFLFGRGRSVSPDTFTIEPEPVVGEPGAYVFEGALPVPQELFVSDGRSSALVELRDFPASGPLAVEVALGADPTFAGRLVEHDGRAFAGCRVELLDATDPEHPFPAVLAAGATDAEGRFDLVLPRPVPARLVFTPPGQRRLVFLTAESFRALGSDPDVRLPRPGSLSGEVLLPDDGSAPDVRLHLQRLNERTGHNPPPYNPLWGDTADAASYRLGDENRYEIIDLAPGTYLMWLSDASDRNGTWVPVEAFIRFDLAPGERRILDLDLSGRVAENVEFLFLVDGQPATGHSIHLTIHGPMGPETTVLTPDSTGRIRCDVLPIGPATLQVEPDSYEGDLPLRLEPFTISATSGLRIERSWEELAGRVRVLGEDGLPLRDTPLRMEYVDKQLWSGALARVRRPCVTGPEGWLNLELIPGRYRLSERLIDGVERWSFPWGLSAGSANGLEVRPTPER